MKWIRIKVVDIDRYRGEISLQGTSDDEESFDEINNQPLTNRHKGGFIFLIEFSIQGKPCRKHYVARVLKIYDNDIECEVSLIRLRDKNIFYFLKSLI